MLCEDVNLLGLCEDVNSVRKNSIIDHFSYNFVTVFSSDSISKLFISLILMSASCQAPVLKLTCWRWGALTIIIAIVYLDTNHWSLVSLNTLLCTLTSQGIQKTPAPWWHQSSFLEQSAEKRQPRGSTLIQISVIIFSTLPCNCIKRFPWFCSSLLMNTFDFHNNSNIWVSQRPFSSPNQVYLKQLLHVCQRRVKWRPFQPKGQ